MVIFSQCHTRERGNCVSCVSMQRQCGPPCFFYPGDCSLFLLSRLLFFGGLGLIRLVMS